MAASVYTTQTVTSVMERIRDGIKNQTPAAANFALGPSAETAVYSRASVASIVLLQQNQVSPLGFGTETFPWRSSTSARRRSPDRAARNSRLPVVRIPGRRCFREVRIRVRPLTK